jgi:hypothetical protein
LGSLPAASERDDQRRCLRVLVAVLLAPEVILAPLFSPLFLLDAAEIIFLTAAAIVLLMTKILVAVHFLWPFAVIVEGGTWGCRPPKGQSHSEHLEHGVDKCLGTGRRAAAAE